MKFEDIPLGAKIQITVTNGGDMEAKFTSRVMRVGNGGALAIPFMHKGVRVNFAGQNIRIHMEVPDINGSNWTFKGCNVSLVRKDGLIYHKITSKMREGIENRRGERRTFVWVPASFFVEGHPDVINTTLKDISPNGFAFIVEARKRISIQTGRNVSCTITEKDGNQVHMKGKVIRREMVDNNILYGCRCGESNPEVLDYIKRVTAKQELENRDNDNTGFGEKPKEKKR